MLEIGFSPVVLNVFYMHGEGSWLVQVLLKSSTGFLFKNTYFWWGGRKEK